PLIELDGTHAGDGADGLHVEASGVTIRGVDVHSFSHAGIWLDSPGGDTVVGNYLGTDPSGTIDYTTNYGVYVTSPSNTIGGPSAADRNLLSGNTGAGIAVSGSAATGNTVEGDYIGVDSSGETALGNTEGVLITAGASNEQVGAPGAGNV